MNEPTSVDKNRAFSLASQQAAEERRIGTRKTRGKKEDCW